jgi:Cep192 domain 4
MSCHGKGSNEKTPLRKISGKTILRRFARPPRGGDHGAPDSKRPAVLRTASHWAVLGVLCLGLMAALPSPVLQGQSAGNIVFVGAISTVAGNGTGGFSGDGGPATQAELGYPFLSGVTKDSAGNLYICDSSNARIRKVDTSGTITTFAGNGTGGYSGDGGAATSAAINGPSGIVADAAGDVFFAEFNNEDIREVNTSGTISTYASLPSQPTGLSMDAAGNFYVALYSQEEILKVATDGTQTVVAGDGSAGYSGDGGAATSASLNNPNGVFVDGAGNIFINDANNEVIRKVDASGNISTFAGNNTSGYSGDGGPATSAQLNNPQYGVTEDSFGNVFIADGGNNVVRNVNTSGIISTVAGTGAGGYSGDGGPATAAKLNFPAFLAIGKNGGLYITDTYNAAIRKVGPFTGLNFGSVDVGRSLLMSVGVENTGGVAVNFGSIAADGDFAVQSTSTCAVGTALGAGATCTVDVLYTPSAVGAATGTLTLTDDASTSTQTLPLAGSGTSSGAAVKLSAASLDFGAQDVGVASSEKKITVTNSGSADLVFGSGAATVSGSNAADFGVSSDTCSGNSVAAASTCEIGVTFTPGSAAGESATLKLADNATDSPQSVLLSGTGVDFSLSAGTSSASVAAGGTATFTLQVSPENGFADTVALACSGAPAQSTCTVNPASVTLDGTNNATATVTVATQASSGTLPLAPALPGVPPLALWFTLAGLAGLAALAHFGPRRLRVRFGVLAPLAVLLMSLAFAASCGRGSSNKTPVNTGTPSGTYPLTITGTSGSLSRTASLSLTVQ